MNAVEHAVPKQLKGAVSTPVRTADQRRWVAAGRQLTAVLVLLSSAALNAETIRITIENRQPEGSFSLTPFWVAAHDGDFDVWSSGQDADDFPGLEALAEEGMTGPISEAFLASSSGAAGASDATIVAADQAPPVFSPGEVAQGSLEVDDPQTHRWFSYASMVIPSNDLFVATSVPTTHELYDESGNFTGPLVVNIYGRDVVDAGTEVNDIAGGAAFSALGGDAVDEDVPLADLFDRDPDANYLESIIGTETATGATVDSRFSPDELIAVITITELPQPRLVVEIENTSPEGGFSLTPFWIAAHDGNFDIWSSGELASAFPGLEPLAEEGMTAPIAAAFAMSTGGIAGGTEGTVLAETLAPPVFSPGETSRGTLMVLDPKVHRFFSWASMVIPSNDLFAATSVPDSLELFDEDGHFSGPVSIEIFGRDVVDAGTEVNDIAAGAAFSALGGDGADESEPLADLFVRDAAGAYLDSIVGTETATGATIASRFSPDDMIARITINLDVRSTFVRGDTDGSGRLDITDPIRTLAQLFRGARVLACEKAADANDDGAVDISDAMFSLNYLFLSAADFPAPFPDCGADETVDFLTCDDVPACSMP